MLKCYVYPCGNSSWMVRNQFLLTKIKIIIFYFTSLFHEQYVINTYIALRACHITFYLHTITYRQLGSVSRNVRISALYAITMWTHRDTSWDAKSNEVLLLMTFVLFWRARVCAFLYEHMTPNKLGNLPLKYEDFTLKLHEGLTVSRCSRNVNPLK